MSRLRDRVFLCRFFSAFVVILSLILSTPHLANAKFIRTPGATIKLCYFYFGTLGDLGYTFSFHTGRLRLQEDLKTLYPDITIESLYENKVFTSGMNRTQNLLDYVRRGCHMIISNSNENFIQNMEDGDENFSIWAATMYPNVSFLIGGGSNIGFRSTSNMIRFAQDPAGGFYLAGVAAAHEAKRCVAFFSAYERSIGKSANGFIRGVRSVNPNIPVHVVTLNSFYRPAAESRMAKLLMDDPTEADLAAVHNGEIPTTHLRGCNVFARQTDPHSTDEVINERLTYKSAANDTKYFSIAPSTNVGLYVGDSVLTSVYTRWDLKLMPWIQQVIENGTVDRGNMADDEVLFYGLDGGYMVPAPLSPLAKLSTQKAFDSLRATFTEDLMYCENVTFRDGSSFTQQSPGSCMNRTRRHRIVSYLQDPNLLIHDSFQDETDCPPGTFFSYSTTGVMELTCTPCPEHTFSEAAGSPSCTTCPEDFEAFGQGNAICQLTPIVEHSGVWARAFAAVVGSVVAVMIAVGVIAGRLYFKKPHGVTFAPLDGNSPFSIIYVNTNVSKKTIFSIADATECFVLQQAPSSGNEVTIVVGRSLPHALHFLHELQDVIPSRKSHLWPKQHNTGDSTPKLLAAVNYGHGSITAPQRSRDEPVYSGRVVDVACELFSIATGLHDTVTTAVLTTAEVAATAAELSSRSPITLATVSSASTTSMPSFSVASAGDLAADNIDTMSMFVPRNEEGSTTSTVPAAFSTAVAQQPKTAILSSATFRAIGDRKFKGGIIRRVASLSIGPNLQHPRREDVVEAQQHTVIVGTTGGEADGAGGEELASFDSFLPIPKDIQTETVLRRGSAIHVDCTPATTSKELFFYHQTFTTVVELFGGQVEYASGLNAVGTFGVHRANVLHEQNACQCALKLREHLTTTICLTSGKMASCTQQHQGSSHAQRIQCATGQPISILHGIATCCNSSSPTAGGCLESSLNRGKYMSSISSNDGIAAKASGGSVSIHGGNRSLSAITQSSTSGASRIFVQESVVHPTSFLSLPHDVLGLLGANSTSGKPEVTKVVVHELFSEQSWPFFGKVEDAVAFKDSFQKLRNGDCDGALKQHENISHYNTYTARLHAMIEDQMISMVSGKGLPEAMDSVSESLPPRPHDAEQRQQKDNKGYCRLVLGGCFDRGQQRTAGSISVTAGSTSSAPPSVADSSKPHPNPLLGSVTSGSPLPSATGTSMTNVTKPIGTFSTSAINAQAPKSSQKKILAGEVSSRLVSHQNAGVVEDDSGGLFSMFVQSPAEPATVESNGNDAATNDAKKPIDGEVPMTLYDISGTAWLRCTAPISTGSYASVYRAINEQGSTVCIKLFDLEGRVGGAALDPDMIAEEVSTLATYTHENIIGYITYGFADRYAFIVMEHAAGGSLYDSLKMFTRFSIGTVRNYFREALRGLEYLHSQNVIHCDVKPHNILIGGDGICKIADFGSTVVNGFGDSFTTGHIIARGTAPYMSPEACRGQEVAAGDIWSIGISMIEILTGKLPWGNVDGSRSRGVGNLNHFIAKLGADENMKPKIPCDFIEEQCAGGGCEASSSSVAKDLVELLEACLARDPSCRPTAAEVLRMRFFQQ